MLLESQVLPSEITALHCAFSSEEHRVQFKHVVREVFGFTPTHSLVHDIRMLLNATVEVSQSLADEDLRNTVARAANLAASDLEPVHVAAYVEQLGKRLAPPSVKQHLAAIRMLCDWLVVSQVIATNPAAPVRGPRHVVRKGKTRC